MKAGTAMLMALRLAKAGYWGGEPGRVLRAPTDEVIAAMQYENFCGDFERASYEMNKGD